MENLSYQVAEDDLLCEEHTEILWSMIEDVCEKKDDSLFKLATELTGGSKWISPTIIE